MLISCFHKTSISHHFYGLATSSMKFCLGIVIQLQGDDFALSNDDYI